MEMSDPEEADAPVSKRKKKKVSDGERHYDRHLSYASPKPRPTSHYLRIRLAITETPRGASQLTNRGVFVARPSGEQTAGTAGNRLPPEVRDRLATVSRDVIIPSGLGTSLQ